MDPGVLLVLWPPNLIKPKNINAYFIQPNLLVIGLYALLSVLSYINLTITGSNQAYRAISTGQLNALLRLHLRPIDVVVYHGPQGYLVLRGASRLDAFSGYPVRS